MFILCDTSSILMLLQIAPDMFRNDQYGCKTIREIHDEIIQTTKFKSKYPWVKEIRSKVKPLVLNSDQKQKEELFFQVIRELNFQGTINQKTGKLFDLSYEDMKLISNALSLEYKVTTGDKGIVQFSSQEFKEDFQGNISPLEIIIYWLENKLITWDHDKQALLEDWAKNNEHPQQAKAKARFMELTGYKYCGS